MEGNTASPSQNLGERHAKEGLWEIYYAQLYYLVETQWLKPRPVQVHSGMIEHQPVDIIQTVVHFPQAPRAVDAGYRVDFHLDKFSHLPLEIAFPSDDSQGTSYGRGTYYVRLADYADENGIQIPRKIGHMRKPDIPVTVQFNVDYDANIFERPPSVKAGPDAWRSRQKKS